MKKFFLFAILTLISVFIAFSASAAEYYIDSESGNDGNSGSQDAPWQTLYNIDDDHLNGGDSVFLKGTFSSGTGVHLETTFEGTAEAPTSIMNWPGQIAVITLGSGIESFIIEGDYFYIAGIEFSNNGTLISDSTAINVRMNTQGNTIQDCIVHDAGVGITVENNTQYTDIIDNTFFDNRQVFYLNVGAADLQIRNNLIYDNDNQDIIDLRSAGENIIVTNNFFYNNGTTLGSTIRVRESTEATSVWILNNSFLNNGIGNVDANIRISSHTSLTIENNIFSSSATGISVDFTDMVGLTSDYNIFYNNTNDFYDEATSQGFPLSIWQSQINQDSNSSSEDPRFVSTGAGLEDLHISLGSPAMEAGSTVTDFLTYDYDFESRPYGATDIGADELPNPDVPTAPITSEITTTGATVSWTAPLTSITSYVLEYSTVADYSSVTILSDITNTTCNLTNLASNTTYYYRIASIYSTNYSNYGSGYATGSFSTAPDAPTALIAAERNAKSISLSWTVPAGTIVSYTLTYATSEDFTKNPNSLEDLTSASQKVTNLSANRKYYFKVLANNGTSDSAYSEVLSARTLPVQIRGVSVPKKFKQATQVKVKWAEPARRKGLKYQIKLMNKQGKKIKIYSTKKLQMTIKKLKSNTMYKIRVRAKFMKSNIGVWSGIVKFKTLGV